MSENMGIYRGKRKDTGEWVEGDLIESDNSHYPMVLIGHVITSRDKHTNALSFDGFDLCEVDPSTVGQFTGLLDKNGERIFESDILLLDGEDGYFKLKFDEDTARFVMIGDIIQVDFDNFYSIEVEVVGNIHDNPELLEVSEND